MLRILAHKLLFIYVVVVVVGRDSDADKKHRSSNRPEKIDSRNIDSEKLTFFQKNIY